MDPEHEPPRPGRPGMGFLAGTALMVLLLLPILLCCYLALVVFTGCGIGCTTPNPFAGSLFGIAAIAMVYLPFVVGSAISQRSRRNWITAMWVAVAAVVSFGVGWLTQ